MARIATTNWISGAVAPSRLRLYHVLFVLLTTVSAVAIAAPSVLTQPTLYQSSATVRYDPGRFPDLVVDGRPGAPLGEQQQNLGEVLKQSRYPSLGQRGLAFDYPAPGEIIVTSTAFDAGIAPGIASDAAEGLARRIYAIRGLELLRDVLGHAYQAGLERHPYTGREDRYLANLLQTQAIPNVTPQQGSRPLSALSPAELSAVTRALEVQEELILINLRQAERDVAAGDERDLAAARGRQRGALNALTTVRLLTTYLIDTYNTSSDMRSNAPAFVAQDASTAIALDNYAALKLLAAAVAGLLGGLFTVLLDRTAGIANKLAELWAYRELIRNMVRRDLKARYKNSLLGYFWSLLNPLLTMLIFWIVFSVLLRNDIPMFPVFLLVALLPWNFAVTAVSAGMRSILDNAHLVKKVYFPREILPITVVLANLINYLLALPVMFAVMAGVQLSQVGHLQFSWSFAFLPVILIIQIIFLVGATLLLSTVAVFFRDTTHIIDILIQLWIFLTPVFYSLDTVTRGNALAAKAVRWLNPMASLIDFYRDILYGQATNPSPGLPALDGVSRTLFTALIIFAIGSYVFHRNSSRFGEEL